MNIAYITSPGQGDIDQLLFRLAQTLAKKGYRTCGTVQVNTERSDDNPCDMDVKVLPDGPTMRISQTLGAGAKGCRLDPNVLETAVGLVENSIAQGADVMIINKFGKHEADGRGFRSVIAEALSIDIPVLVGLSRLNKAAFLDFSEGLAIELPAKETALVDWLVGQKEDVAVV